MKVPPTILGPFSSKLYADSNKKVHLVKCEKALNLRFTIWKGKLKFHLWYEKAKELLKSILARNAPILDEEKKLSFIFILLCGASKGFV